MYKPNKSVSLKKNHIIKTFHAILHFILLMEPLYAKMHAHQWLTKRGNLKRRKAKRAKGGKSKKWKTIKTDTGTQDKRWLTSPWKRILSKTTKTKTEKVTNRQKVGNFSKGSKLVRNG